MKNKMTPAPLYKVKSIVNSEYYYSSKSFPEKIIDGKVFIGVKKLPSDNILKYMLKQNMVRCNK